MRRILIAAIAMSIGAPGLVFGQSAEEILREFDAEPGILEVQEAAAAYAHIDQGTMDGWSTRATVSALLPEFRGQYWITGEDDEQTDTDRDFDVVNDQLVLTGEDRDQRIENDDEVRIRLQGDWDLPNLIFNPDLLRISKEVSDLVELREDILATVTTLYFERRRAQAQMRLDPPSNAIDRLRRELEIQELTAGIDALTGGWFSGELSARGLPSY